MDSQENALQQGTEEVKQAEEAANVNPPVGEEAAQPAAESAANEKEEVDTATEETQAEDNPAEDTPKESEDDYTKKVYNSKKEIVNRLNEIASSDATPDKAEIEHLKTLFYKLHFAEREADQKAYLEAGGDPEKYQILPDDDEQAFKAEMTIIKEKRQKAYQELEQLKQENLQKKLDIIEKIKSMVTTAEEANANFQNFKALQAEWKEIKPVPAEKANELWRSYQLYVEQFYDLINLNREAREYDFKKNLEKKLALCEAAEKLAEEKDVISASRKLQDLHIQYRETGPVDKELREKVWARFKAASTVVNKRHQQYFEERRNKEVENLEKKTALCEQIEAIIKESNNSNADWEKHTQAILDLQQEWKKIGFATAKENQKIFDRFRAACDDFFSHKNAFYKERRAMFSENADKKRALIAKAQELMDSTEWRQTADKLIELQKEWKTIGLVPHKLGDELWKEFRAACDHFFDARTAAFADVHKEEDENLKKKLDVIARLKALLEQKGDDLQKQVQTLSDEFYAIGHVPMKQKEKVYADFRATLDKIYKELHINSSRRRMDNFRSNLRQVASRGADALDTERGRLMHRFDQLKAEINTYENNLGFLSVSSKKGNSLIEEMKRKVQRLRDELEETRQKIKAVDAENKEKEDGQKENQQ